MNIVLQVVIGCIIGWYLADAITWCVNRLMGWRS